MPTALERAIDQLSDPAVQLADALRALLVVAKRIDAPELSDWIKHELGGFTVGDVPSYRRIEGLDVTLSLDGPGGSTQTIRVPFAMLPTDLRLPNEYGDVTISVAQLQSLADSGNAAYKHVPDYWLNRYRTKAEKGEVPSYTFMIVNRARVEIPRANLLAVLDGIKTAALELALDLEDVSADVGSPGGPTVSDSPALQQVVNASVVNWFHDGGQVTVGAGANVAIGDGASAVRVDIGDIEGVLREATRYLQPEGVEALSNALSDDGGKPGYKTNKVLERVKAGGLALAGDMVANGAYDGLVALLAMAFPGFSG